jgi:hypothetical protein
LQDIATLGPWVAQIAASGARVTVVANDGLVLADSQSDTSTMENHASRPEIRDAFAKGTGRSIRHSVTINRDLLYYAVRQDLPAGPPVVLRFALPVETVDEVLRSFRRSLWLASLVILLLASGAALLISRAFSDRVERLREFSRRVAGGDFHPLPADRSGDALEALAVSLADNMTLADFIDLRFGSEYQTIQYMGHVSAYKPFGSADIHLSRNTVVEYQYATSVPTTRHQKGFDSAPADLSESGPRMSLQDNTAVLERARHHEVSVSQRIGRNSFQAAWYTDSVANPALVGVGEVTADTGEFLPDFYSGTFTYGGRNIDTSGIRLVFQRKLWSDLTATVNYSYGGSLDLTQGNANWADVRGLLENERHHAVTGKVNGLIPFSHTRWLASYKWTSGGLALTPVDMFNVSAGQSDPFLNIFVRQPIPGMGFMPGRMEALVDVRNLLAQGYIPVMGRDGRTMYLVQSARSIRGGVAFTF